MKLNLGCGARKMQSVVNVDIDASVNPDIQADIEKDWSFAEDGAFDEIYAYSIMEHLYDTHHFLKECSRVLKAKGLLFLSVPFFYHYHAHPNDYYRFTVPCLKKLLKEHGFEIVELKATGGRASALVEILFPTKLGSIRNILYKLLSRCNRFIPNSDNFIDAIVIQGKKL